MPKVTHVKIRDALTRIQDVGLDNILHDHIRPRAPHNGDPSLKILMHEPDTRILSVHDWSQHLITTIDKLLIECKDHPRAKALLLRHVQKRQQDTRIRERMRLVREVQATDVDAARKEVAGGANPGGKRKQRADSPLDEHVIKAEQQPTKKQRIDLKSLSLGDNGLKPSPSNSNGARRPPVANGINALAPINTSDSAELPITGANTRARELVSTNGARHPLMDSSVSLLAPTRTASNSTEPPSMGSNLDTHPPSNEALQAFRRFRHKRSWVTELLAEDLDRIEAINRLIGPKARGDRETEAAKFSAHMISSSSLGDATRDMMAGKSAGEFLAHYRLRVLDEHSYLAHHGAVTQTSARKLVKYIKEEAALHLSWTLLKRVRDLL